jgi:hypothetical protein
MTEENFPFQWLQSQPLADQEALLAEVDNLNQWELRWAGQPEVFPDDLEDRLVVIPGLGVQLENPQD